MRRFHLGAALGGLIFAGAGAMFLLDALGRIELLPEYFLPAIVIALGIAVVMNALIRRSAPDGTAR